MSLIFRRICTKCSHIISIIILLLLNVCITYEVRAEELQTFNNIDLVIMCNDNTIDNQVENIVVNNGGQIIRTVPELGTIEVECAGELIPKLESMHSVKTICINSTIQLKRDIVLYSNDNNSNNNYYEDKSTNYYEDKGNSYYEDKGTSYYEDKGNSYYEDKGTSYYEDNNNDDVFTGNLYDRYQWDVKKVTNNGESYKINKGNHSIVIGIIDSGIDTKHQDLVMNFLGGKNLVPNHFKNDISELGDINDVKDRYGHGTNVAGQIAANGRLKGVAPNIGIKSYRIFNKNGQTDAATCADAIINAVNDNVNVINLSFNAYYLKGACTYIDSKTGNRYDLGDDTANYELLRKAIKYAVDNNVIVVTSAGNNSLNCSNSENLIKNFNDLYENYGLYYTGLMRAVPGCFDEVINVSATNKNDLLSSYSNYGYGFIDISAPGGDNDDDINGMCLTTNMDNGYAFVYGTSFAAPKVSALAGLILSNNPQYSVQEVIKKINDTSIKSNNRNSKEYYGEGIINCYNALND